LITAKGVDPIVKLRGDHGVLQPNENASILEGPYIIDLDRVSALGSNPRGGQLRDEVQEIHPENRDHDDEGDDEGPQSGEPFLIPSEAVGHGDSGLREGAR
jgi:hypothetical protein